MTKNAETNIKRKGFRFPLYLTFCALCVTLTACGRESVIKEPIADNTTTGNVSYQTSDFGISQADIAAATRNGESALENNWFYVIHHTEDTVTKNGKIVPGEDVYYPVVYYKDTFGGSTPDITLNPNRIVFFTTENEHEIPTLFLGKGDKLVFYSTDTLLDYIVWERFYDMKYTIGVWNLQQMINGRVWLNLDEDDDEYILNDSELYPIYDLGVANVMLDKIGGVPITGEMINYGLLSGATKSRVYDLEVYAGTYYKHYLTTANIRAMHSYELFASTNYETKQGYIYEIDVPDYFVDGFYMVSGTGMFRLITGDSYNEATTDYNVRLLYPGTNRTGYVSEEVQASINALLEGREKDVDWSLIGYPSLYSECEALNHFSTNLEGKLGYVPDRKEEEDNKFEQEENKQPQLIEATTKDIELYFPAGVDCAVRIVSPSKETTGDCFLQVGNSIYKLSYDFLMGDYAREFAFREDTYGTLHIQGLFDDCQVQLTGCEQGSAPVAEQESSEETATQKQGEKTETTPKDSRINEEE